MNMKLIMVMTGQDTTEVVMEAARDAGATGATVITSVRGEGLKGSKTFFGLELGAQRDVLLFLVAGQRAQRILETIAKAGNFDEEPGTGIAVQVSLEDAVGLKSQTSALLDEIKEEV